MMRQVIVEWHASVNSGDLERAARAVGHPILVLGPRGSAAITPAQFAEWVERSGIRLEPVGWHPAGERLTVVEQNATWPGSSDPTRVATAFRVDGGVVTAALRYPDLATALARAANDLAVTGEAAATAIDRAGSGLAAPEEPARDDL